MRTTLTYPFKLSATAMPPAQRLMSAVEVADLLAVSPATVRRLIRSGELPAVRVGGQHRISPERLSAYMDAPEGREVA